MKKNVFALVALAALSLTACKKENATVETDAVEADAPAADAVTYNAVAAESKIDWIGSKVSGDQHAGTIALKEGMVMVANNMVTGGKFTIDMNTITVTDITDAEKKAGLEGHLKGATAENADHFFNVSKFPTATFEITKVADENGKQMVEGNLTIKEATHGIKFPATVTVTEGDVTIASDEFEIDRTKWAVNYNSGSIVKDLGDKVINDNIKLKFVVKATK
ncbi:YceI family protein [Myroides sp. JBRI-B21084]|uniref:YceI family protein n=1 Tax=Myroides sp. JBRI-B21084 TaxID=3119977 RepID=UPI0026E1734F|nr:YceI family protein [Paenimyroides cloacae]WKW46583.1 YceI family protein [Paenimyroides cloacae]